MSIAIHYHTNATCIGVYDAPPFVNDAIDQHITAWALKYAAGVYEQHIKSMQEESNSAVVVPAPVHTFQRIQTEPRSYASYIIGSVLCLQVSPHVVSLQLVVNRDVGWVRKNIRHRALDLGKVSFIPALPGVLPDYVKTQTSQTASRHLKEMDSLEQEMISLATKNQVLEERCATLLQHARGVVGDKVAFECVNAKSLMSYTPISE